MTKYVLNSGGIRRHPDLKKKFHQELVKGRGDAPKFLLCNFAQVREDWENKFHKFLDIQKKSLVSAIGEKKELKEDLEAELKSAILEFKKGYGK